MTPLVPIAMFGWLFISIMLFSNLPAQRAVIGSVIIGFLFLPVAAYDLPVIPTYDKYSALSFGLLLGTLTAGNRGGRAPRMSLYDLPMLLWCTFCPIATSLSNNLGLYNGISGLMENVLRWGVFYWAGRKYLREPSALRMLTRGIILGGLLYIPLVLFEIRMSPQLSNMLYGIFPHSFVMHVRYGGFRPIIFMHSGLMVALWMSITATLTFWMWRTGEIKKMGGVSTAFLSICLMAATILCKSGNGIVFMLLGIVACLCFQRTRSARYLRWGLIIIPIYISLRLANLVTIEQIGTFAREFFDMERTDSLTTRLLQETLFGARSMERPLFGWGGYSRGWPVDPETGIQLIQMIDSLWLILFNTYGACGLVSAFLAIGTGPWQVFALYRRALSAKDQRDAPFAVDAIALSLVLVIFLLDSLLNAMLSPVYILCAGALVSYCQGIRSEAPSSAIALYAQAR